MQDRHRVAVLGSGNWLVILSMMALLIPRGSAIAKIVAENTSAHTDAFYPTVEMWVHEESLTVPQASKAYDPSSAFSTTPHNLTHLINELHENVRYLPNVKLPSNLHANPDLRNCVEKATILIFNLPHQFMNKLCHDLQGLYQPYARGISCIKGVDVSSNEISLFSESIGRQLGIYCGALSGANIASEVALEKFSETTIAYDPPLEDSREHTPSTSHTNLASLPAQSLHPLPRGLPALDHELIKSLFHRPYFHVRVVSDVAGVSLGGALKNVIALAAGFVAGLDWGDNAKAAIMRVGLMEMVKFGKMFFPCANQGNTFLEESAGVADLITSCSGGRNFRCAKMAVQKSVSVETIEQQELNGQKLQGIGTTREVFGFLSTRKLEHEFPLLVATYHILQGHVRPEQLPDLIESRTS